ncbi:MAG TPA: hypothetical protein VGK32_08430 [Vicinamibacterales bacterium]|jgi:hypothetical protein
MRPQWNPLVAALVAILLSAVLAIPTSASISAPGGLTGLILDPSGGTVAGARARGRPHTRRQ